MYKIIFLAFGLCLLTQNIWAQSPSLTETSKNTEKLRLSHSPFVPLGLLYGGIGYDCRFRMPNSSVDFAASLSGGGGAFWFGGGTVFTDVPLSGSIIFGKGWHAFETGLTLAYVDTRTQPFFYYTFDIKNTHDKFLASMLTAGYRLQAPNHGIFMKVYGGFGGGISNREVVISGQATTTQIFIVHAFLRLALGYSF